MLIILTKDIKYKMIDNIYDRLEAHSTRVYWTKLKTARLINKFQSLTKNNPPL